MNCENKFPIALENVFPADIARIINKDYLSEEAKFDKVIEEMNEDTCKVALEMYNEYLENPDFYLSPKCVMADDIVKKGAIKAFIVWCG